MSTATKERPILFSGEMVRAILAKLKTQTRRIVKEQPPSSTISHNVGEFLGEFGVTFVSRGPTQTHSDNYCLFVRCPYGQPGDRLYGDTDERYNQPDEHNQTAKRRRASTDTSLAEQRLHGGFGRSGVLANEVRGIREEDSSGLVSAGGPSDGKGISVDYALPREQEGDKECSPADLLGVSRGAAEAVNASATPGQQPSEQPAVQSMLGDAGRELRRQNCDGSIRGGREASLSKTNGRGSRPFDLGTENESVQPETRGESSGNVAGVHTADRRQGSRLWVRECFWAHPANNFLYQAGTGRIHYDADLDEAKRKKLRAEGWKKKPSIHMPRWASRLTLEIVSVRVERLQEISEEDAIAEGCPGSYTPAYVSFGEVCGPDGTDPRDDYRDLWNKINGPGAWEANPWVWAIEFKRLEAN